MQARVIYSCLFFVLTMVLIAVAKPSAFFDASTGRPRPFGAGAAAALEGARPTPFALGVATAVAAVMSMFVFSLIDLLSRSM